MKKKDNDISKITHIIMNKIFILIILIIASLILIIETKKCCATSIEN